MVVVVVAEGLLTRDEVVPGPDARAQLRGRRSRQGLARSLVVLIVLHVDVVADHIDETIRAVIDVRVRAHAGGRGGAIQHVLVGVPPGINEIRLRARLLVARGVVREAHAAGDGTAAVGGAAADRHAVHAVEAIPEVGAGDVPGRRIRRPIPGDLFEGGPRHRLWAGRECGDVVGGNGRGLN